MSEQWKPGGYPVKNEICSNCGGTNIRGDSHGIGCVDCGYDMGTAWFGKDDNLLDMGILIFQRALIPEMSPDAKRAAGKAFSLGQKNVEISSIGTVVLKEDLVNKFYQFGQAFLSISNLAKEINDELKKVYSHQSPDGTLVSLVKSDLKEVS